MVVTVATAADTPEADAAWYRLGGRGRLSPAGRRSGSRPERGRGGRAATSGTGRTSSPRRPRSRRWKAFLRQYRDLMQLVLVGAAVVSIVAMQDVSTGLVVLGLTVLNALMGLHQEGKAAESVAALRQMLIMTASVRRDGQLVEIPAEELVPGDIVGFEAGDKVPADGRILVAATLEIEEAGLTGESTPVAKSVDPVTGDDVPLGDRVDMAYMNSQVTRGRGEMVVTATGMATEVGHISGMLSGVEQEKTPLTKQLDQLTVLITIMAAAALVLIVILGLARGEDFDTLFLDRHHAGHRRHPDRAPGGRHDAAVGRDPASWPSKGAIVKRLRSVETLGSTSAICSDKTGTLTLNQMTARELVVVGRRFSVDGEGYSTDRAASSASPASGESAARAVHAADGAGQRRRDPRRRVHRRPDRGRARRARRQGRARRRGDPAGATRASPRCPFDAEYKLMATFHEMDDGGRTRRALLRQGRPRRAAGPLVALPRRRRIAGADGADAADRVLAENDRLAGEGLRVLAVARRDFDPATFDPTRRPAGAGRPTSSCSPSSASSTRRARRPRTPSPCARTPASASA